MSGFGTITSVAQIALLAGSNRSLRSVGGLTAQVVSEESHTDEMEITEHPVEQGASITDHAFKKPAQLVLRYGWSASPSPSPGLRGLLPPIIPPAPVDIRDIYNKLLGMQVNRQLLDVYTGKRAYRNMLIRSLEVDTDVSSEYSLPIIISLQELLLVTTTTTQSTGVGANNDPNKVEFMPTYPVQQGGTFQLLPAPTYNPGRTTFLNAGPVPGG